MERASPRVKRAMAALQTAQERAEVAQRAHNAALADTDNESRKVRDSADQLTAAHRAEENALERLQIAQRAHTRLLSSSKASQDAVADSEARLTIAHNNHQTAIERINVAERSHATVLKDSTETNDRLTNTSHRLAAARRNEADAHRSAASELRKFANDARDGIGKAEELGGVLQDLGTSAFRSGRGLLAVIAPLAIKFIGDFIAVVVTASQSIAELPAIALTAAAGIGTLALATQGFGQTIKDIGDPKKFAEDLQGLSPAAQQAALSIQHLMPQFTALKNATQDAFFSGIGTEIEQLTATYLPGIQSLTTSIASSFNNMLTGIGDKLMTPDAQASLQAIFGNISQFFINAAPAAQSLTQAFLDLADVGSSFLPGFGSGIANLAQEFANFIREAKNSGQLKEWIQDGIDAVKALADGVVILGNLVFDIFGGDGKKNINTFKNDMQGLNEIVQALNGNLKPIWEDMRGDFKEVGIDIENFFTKLPDHIANGFIRIGNFIKDQFTHIINWIGSGINMLIDGINAVSPFPDIPHIPEMKIDNVPLINTDNAPAGHGPFTDTRGPGALGLPSSVGVGPGRRGPGALGLPTPPPGPGSKPFRSGGPYAVPSAPASGGGTQKDKLDAAISALNPDEYRIDPFGGMPGGGAAGGGPTVPGPVGPVAMPNAAGLPDVRGAHPQLAYALSAAQQMFPGLKLTAGMSDHPKDQGWHPRGQAIDIGGDPTQMAALSNWLLQFAPSIEELIHAGPGVTRNIKSGKIGPAIDMPGSAYNTGQAGYHGDHVHLAITDQMASMFEQALGSGGSMAPGTYGPLQYQQGSPYDSPVPGYYKQDPQKIEDDKNRVESTAHDLEEARKKRIAMEKGNLGDAQEIEKARWDEHEKEVAWRKAQRELADAQQGTFEKLNSQARGAAGSMSDIGVQLDQDFGISKGLPGIAENLTRFIANLAFAPMMGQLAAIQQGNAQATGISGGYGALGITAAQDMAAGRPPLGIPMLGQQPGMGMPGMNPAAGGPPMLNAMMQPGKNWDALAGKESSGNWQANTGNGYSGGLQFDQATWNAYGGQQFAPQAWQATKEQQISVAQTAYNARGGGATLWPQNYGQLDIPSYDIGGAITADPSHTKNNKDVGSWIWSFGPDSIQEPTGPWSGWGTGGEYRPPPGVDGGSSGKARIPWTVPKNPGNDSPIKMFGDGVPIIAHPGEHVFDRGDVAAMGGQAGVYAFRNSLQNFDDGGAIQDPTNIGGIETGHANPGAGIGMTPGGTLDTAMNMASMLVPGMGQAAATGMKLANRAIQYAGQMVGIGVQGLMETFLPTGASELANNSWATRLIGGLAGASPALPNVAGKSSTQQAPMVPGPVNPVELAPPPQPAGDTTINVEYQNNNATEDRAGKDLTYHLDRQYQGADR